MDRQRKWSWGKAGKIAVCLAVSLLLAGCGKPMGGGAEDVPSTVETTAEISVTELIESVLTLKRDIKGTVNDIQANDPASAMEKMESISRKTETIRASLDASVEALGDGKLKAQLENIRDLLDLADQASKKVAIPLLSQLQQHPLAELRTDAGIRVEPLLGYLDLAGSLMPDIEALVEKANDADLGMVDSDGKIAGYLETANDLLELYRRNGDMISKVKAMLGAEGDRLYLIAAQNSAEIRASGGFPGAMGTLRIRDGVLLLEGFEKVYDVLASSTPQEAQVTANENRLFHSGLNAPRDADFCPDFERVAYIWALGYEARQQEAVDGVISVTPAVLQKLLNAIDGEIKLFDGTVVNGKNGVKVLQHDLYFTYFGKEKVPGAEATTDQLFAEAAKKAADLLTENMGLSNLKDYFSVAWECAQDRTLMLWMAEEGEQALIRNLGWHGGLNDDPQKPQAGVYYNCTIASKMGWFLNMDTQIGERVKNEDGSYTYPITVNFSNDITKEEIRSAGNYITAGQGGAIIGSAYFFAPAGGSVSDFTVSGGLTVSDGEYDGLSLGFLRPFRIPPDRPVTVTYSVTTAPGAETELTLSKTPTVQDYHE